MCVLANSLILIDGLFRFDIRNGVDSTGSKTEEEEDHSEEVSICQSPISVNSHLQCRASSIDLSLPIAEMQESGFSEDNIKSHKYFQIEIRYTH